MSEKSPFSYPIWTYVWVFGLAALGGVIAALKKDQSFRKSLADILSSLVAGLVTFWLCEANNINPLYSAVYIIVNGHFGTRVLKRLGDTLGPRYVVKYKNRRGVTTSPGEISDR
jgi:CHASE2 domain-containing sensor protein